MDDETYTQIKYFYYNRHSDHHEEDDLLVEGSPEDSGTIKRAVKQLQYKLKQWYWQDHYLSGSFKIKEVNELIRMDEGAPGLKQALTLAHDDYVSKRQAEADKKKTEEKEASERRELARLRDKYHK